MTTNGSIILVDYVVDERTMYAEAIGDAGFVVEIYDDPVRALDRAMRDIPCAVVTRIVQPGREIDGIELTRRLKGDPRTRAVPVIVITTRIEPELRVDSTLAGCDALLPIPCLPEELIAVLKALLRRSGSPV